MDCQQAEIATFDLNGDVNTYSTSLKAHEAMVKQDIDDLEAREGVVVELPGHSQE